MSTLASVRKAQCRISRHTLLSIESFTIERGQHWCVFGRNGSGKTLLANLLAGKRLESSTYVTYSPQFDPSRDLHIVSFEEQQRLWERDNRLDISEFSSDAQDQGTVVEDLIRVSRAEQDQDDTLFHELSKGLSLNTVLRKGIRFLSSGQIRKVLIAKALYAYRDGLAQLVIFDDPLESIDRDSQQQIKNTIKHAMNEQISSLQLCRRRQDILPGISHMAVMQRTGSHLQIVSQGPLIELLDTEAFASLGQGDVDVSAALRLLPAASRAQSKLDAEPKSDEELIRLNNVSANYAEQKVLSKVNWTMTAKHHVVVQGPNGCGKSTLLSLIDGENHKGYGQQVFLRGRLKGSGETIWDTKKHFGLVSNELHNKYIKGWRVLDVVVSGFFDSVGLYDDSGSSEIALATQWIEALGLCLLEKQYYHEISFGQQRLVLLARAMVKNPRILILD